MCKHVLNAQVAIRFPCCLRFYDCVDCHEEGKEGGKKRGHAMTRAGTWYLVLVVVLLLLLLSLLLPLSLDHDKGVLPGVLYRGDGFPVQGLQCLLSQEHVVRKLAVSVSVSVPVPVPVSVSVACVRVCVRAAGWLAGCVGLTPVRGAVGILRKLMSSALIVGIAT